jgi:hypothetical protein
MAIALLWFLAGPGLVWLTLQSFRNDLTFLCCVFAFMFFGWAWATL